MSQNYDIGASRERIGSIRCEDNPVLVKQKSRDFYWYSPILKRELDCVTADIDVSPTTASEVATVLAAAHALRIPVTPRGGGTGNYGQAMPLSGGVLLSSIDMNRIVRIETGRVVSEPGALIGAIDKAGCGDRARGAHVPVDAGDRIDRRIHRRRIGRGRLDHVGRPARFWQRSAAARPDDGGRTS